MMLLLTSNLQALNAISGVVYHSGSAAGLAIGGATLTLSNIDSTPTILPANCLATGQQGQIVDSSGAYRFDIQTGANFLCPPASTTYQIKIIPPTDFVLYSANPAQTSVFLTNPCTLDANIPTTECEVNLAVAAPFANTTTMPYFTDFRIASLDVDVVNNHILLQSTLVVPFETTWRTTISNESITIPTNPTFSASYDYDVDWGDGSLDSAVAGDINYIYASAGVISKNA